MEVAVAGFSENFIQPPELLSFYHLLSSTNSLMHVSIGQTHLKNHTVSDHFATLSTMGLRTTEGH